MTHEPETAEDKIEITPEMEEAGIQALGLFSPGDRPDWMVHAIYAAMERAKPHR